MKITLGSSHHLVHAVSFLYVFSKVLFLQVSVSGGILSAFLADTFSSHRNVESSRIRLEKDLNVVWRPNGGG